MAPCLPPPPPSSDTILITPDLDLAIRSAYSIRDHFTLLPQNRCKSSPLVANGMARAVSPAFPLRPEKSSPLPFFPPAKVPLRIDDVPAFEPSFLPKEVVFFPTSCSLSFAFPEIKEINPSPFRIECLSSFPPGVASRSPPRISGWRRQILFSIPLVPPSLSGNEMNLPLKQAHHCLSFSYFSLLFLRSPFLFSHTFGD